MKFIKAEPVTMYTFEMSSTEQLILLGLLSKVVNREEINLDDETIKELTNIRKGLSRY